jgi:hypothetical protein
LALARTTDAPGAFPHARAAVSRRPDDWTQFRQATAIRCRPLAALAAVAEKVETRCAKAREVVERICRYLEAQSAGAAPSVIWFGTSPSTARVRHDAAPASSTCPATSTSSN